MAMAQCSMPMDTNIKDSSKTIKNMEEESISSKRTSTSKDYGETMN